MPTICCTVCKQSVSAKSKQGLTCGGCNKAQHFDCLKLTEEKKQAYLAGEAYLCRPCHSKQRLSLSITASTPPPSKSTRSAVAKKSNHNNINTNNKPSATTSTDKKRTIILLLLLHLQSPTLKIHHRPISFHCLK